MVASGGGGGHVPLLPPLGSGTVYDQRSISLIILKAQHSFNVDSAF